MGIKSNFSKFLKDKCPQAFDTVHLSHYRYKKVAIDISLYLHKFKAVCGDRWLTAFINLVSSLRRNELHCVFIYDGKAPDEKSAEQLERREAKEKLEKTVYELELALDEYHNTGIIPKILKDLYKNRRSPTVKRLLGNNDSEVNMQWVIDKVEQKKKQIINIDPSDFEQTKVLFDLLSVPYYVAPSEAEKMCSKLCIDGLVDAVLSEDTDIIAYGCPIFLSKIDTANDTCVQTEFSTILSGLDISREQFLDFCILCGTDYNKNIPNVGSTTAFKKIKQFDSIEGIQSNTSLDISVLNHERVRQLFTEFEDYNIKDIPYCGQPNFDKLQEFISENKLNVNIDNLRKAFSENIIIFEEDEE